MFIERTSLIKTTLNRAEAGTIILLDGIHRSGKSTCLSALVKELRSSVPPVHVIYLGEGHEIRDAGELIGASRGLGVGPSALCLDDADRISGLAEALAAILARSPTRIFLTGSRTGVIGEGLSNRYGGDFSRVPVLPFTYAQWLEARSSVDSSVEFQRYAHAGGLPDSWRLPGNERDERDFLTMRTDSFILSQIIEPGTIRNPGAIRPILSLLASHSGEALSSRQICDALSMSPYSLSPQSVIDYLDACRLSGIIVPAPVVDLGSSRELLSAQVWYFADNGLRAAFSGRESGTDNDRAIRNLAFLALLGDGWKIRQGRIDAGRERKEEITFVCEREGKRVYIQMVGNAASAGERVRKYRALLSIRDAWPKYLIDPAGLPEGGEISADGVRHLIARDFIREGLPS